MPTPARPCAVTVPGSPSAGTPPTSWLPTKKDVEAGGGSWPTRLTPSPSCRSRLPGDGYSAPPPAGGITAAVVAEPWRDLMVDGLGYRRFAAHGSDIGAGVTAPAGPAAPGRGRSHHLATPSLPAPPHPWTAVEQAHFAGVADWPAEEGGYAYRQRPERARRDQAVRWGAGPTVRLPLEPFSAVARRFGLWRKYHATSGHTGGTGKLRE